MEIGFVGQGYVGKNYADDFERRGYRVVRYALEEPYRENRARIPACDIVFIAVPTPTRPRGFDSSIIYECLSLVGSRKIAVIKSTLIPGLTRKLQASYPKVTILFSPEFLSEKTAAHDAAHPFSNIVGLPRNSAVHRRAAETVHAILPSAPHTLTCKSVEAEIIKYAHNGNGYTQVLFYNMMYDLAAKLGADWEAVVSAVRANPFMSDKYASPVHKGGRGAGGNCFIKDFAALRMIHQAHLANDAAGLRLLRSLEAKNVDLLTQTGKDLRILEAVYGKRSMVRRKRARAPIRRR